ncbi:MAG TPA: hypothetical protein VGE07_00055 [Herpetosiphonaceae bacterium]
MDERSLVKDWIDAMPDDTARPDYQAACAEQALVFLQRLKEAATAGAVRWHRYSYWRSMIMFFIGE